MTKEEYKLKILNQVKNQDKGLLMTLRNTLSRKRLANPYQRDITYYNPEFELEIKFHRTNNDCNNPRYRVLFNDFKVGAELLKSSAFIIEPNMIQEHYKESIEYLDNTLIFTQHLCRVDCTESYDYEFNEYHNMSTKVVYLNGDSKRNRGYTVALNKWRDTRQLANSYIDYVLDDELKNDILKRIEELKEFEIENAALIELLEAFYEDCLRMKCQTTKSTMMRIYRRMIMRLQDSHNDSFMIKP